MTSERIIAGLAAAYFAYRLWTGVNAGIIDGDGDMDVHADRNPAAFVLTSLSLIFLIGVCGVIALGPASGDLVRLVISVWKS